MSDVPEHTGCGNAECCTVCSGGNPDYPFLCSSQTRAGVCEHTQVEELEQLEQLGELEEAGRRVVSPAGTAPAPSGAGSQQPDDEVLLQVVMAVLRDEGGDPGSSLHSWRCEYPDRYGPCSCLREAASAVLDALTPKVAALTLRAEACRLRRLGDHGADGGATPYETADYLEARAGEIEAAPHPGATSEGAALEDHGRREP